MKNFISRMLTSIAAGALAIATVGAISSPAQAALDTYTPHGGPAVSFLGNNITFTDIEANTEVACKQFDLHGTITRPGVSRRLGATATTSDQLVNSDCFHWYFGETTIDRTGSWELAVTGREVGSVAPATLSNAGIFVDMSACSFNIAGQVSGEFDDTTGLFTPTESTLTIADDPFGLLCPIIGFAQGQGISVSGSWLITGVSISYP